MVEETERELVSRFCKKPIFWKICAIPAITEMRTPFNNDLPQCEKLSESNIEFGATILGLYQRCRRNYERIGYVGYTLSLLQR